MLQVIVLLVVVSLMVRTPMFVLASDNPGSTTGSSSYCCDNWAGRGWMIEANVCAGCFLVIIVVGWLSDTSRLNCCICLAYWLKKIETIDYGWFHWFRVWRVSWGVQLGTFGKLWILLVFVFLYWQICLWKVQSSHTMPIHKLVWP